MPPISIKAVLISNAVQFGITVAIFFIAALVTLCVAWGIAGFPADIDPITDEFRASSLLVPSIFSISVVSSSLAAGYVAGRVAGHRPILHGALSSCAWFVILISIGIGVRSSGEPPHGGPDGGSTHAGAAGRNAVFWNSVIWRARRLYRATDGPRPKPAGDRVFAIFKMVVAWLFRSAELDRRRAPGAYRNGDDVVSQLRCCDGRYK